MGQMTLKDVVAGLHRIFASDDVNVHEVQELLHSYKSNPLDWQQYAMFDPHRYTRNLVDRGNGKFNLMILCWGPSMGSSVHDHAKAHCFVKMLAGSLLETKYEWPEVTSDSTDPVKPMIETDRTVYETNGVSYINDKIGLHRMENASHTENAISLHVYIPAFQKCRTFDTRTGQKTLVRFTFWSEYGQRLTRHEEKDTAESNPASNPTSIPMSIAANKTDTICASLDPRSEMNNN